MSGNLDYDSVLKMVSGVAAAGSDWPYCTPYAFDGLAAGWAEQRETEVKAMPAVAAVAMLAHAPPPTPGGRAWVDETST